MASFLALFTGLVTSLHPNHFEVASRVTARNQHMAFWKLLKGNRDAQTVLAEPLTDELFSTVGDYGLQNIIRER